MPADDSSTSERHGSGGAPSPAPHLHFVVALPAEARPLVRHYALRRVEDAAPFPVFHGDGVLLVVSGVGKVAAAAATTYLYAWSGWRRNQVWINVGVAGHPWRDLGEACLVHKIVDAGSSRRFYPPLLFDSPVLSDEVATVEQPVDGYPEEVLYDMEAAGFWPTASRFSPGELVACLKVVSDNRASPLEAVDARRIEGWIEARLAVVTTIAESLLTLARTLPVREPEPGELEPFVARWRFTVSQRRRLSHLLRRWRILVPGEEPRLEVDGLAGHTSAKEVLTQLEQRLDQLPVRLH